MTNFEKITASPAALGAFLASLSIENGPWDESFHKEFCDSCEREDCDVESCPRQEERSKPMWWLTKETEGEQGTVDDRNRELLIYEYERRLARLKSGASPCGVIWRNGRAELKSGMIVPLQDEERHDNGTCNGFNVYLNGKGPDEKILRNIKRVILPTVSTTENGQIGPMNMKLVFGGCEDAAEIVALLGKKCKLEVRAAVENWTQEGQVEFHGHSYVLDDVPLEIDSDTVKRRAGLGMTIGFLVYRYTATVGDTELWDFEWSAQRRKKRIWKGAGHMARKKMYPGGFRLTLATARKLAIQEFGTAKGLKKPDWASSEGFYIMDMGNLEINIRPDMSGSGCIEIDISMHGAPGHIYQLHDRDTLNRNYKEEDVQRRKEQREAFECWVSGGGPEPCHKAIDDFWNRR